MARVKLGFARLSVASKILTARSVVNQMTGNAAFPTPSPDLAVITGAVDALEDAAQKALKGGTDKTLAKHLAEADLNALMGSLQDYVQVASDGKPLVIESSGMEVRKERKPASLPPAVLNVRASVGGNPGEIKLIWDGLPEAKSYVVEMLLPEPKTDSASAPPQPIEGDGETVLTETTKSTITWLRIDTVTKRYLTVKGLDTGTVYSFRLAGINSAGQGDYSQTASSVAP